MAYNVLLVDDELIIRQGMEYLIDWEKEGFHLVGKVKNGQEALEAIEKQTPDIVITDIEMPVMSGLDLAEILARSHPEIRMIMLSAHSDFDYVRPAFSLGAVDYILKPSLSPEELLKVLHKSVQGLQKVHTSLHERHSDWINRYLAGYEEPVEDQTLLEMFPACVVLYTDPSSKKTADQRLEELNQYLEGLGKPELSCGFLIDQSYPAFLVCQKQKEKVKQDLMQSSKTFPVCFFISRPYTSLEDIRNHQSTLSSQLMSSLFYASGKAVIDETQLESGPHQSELSLEEYEASLKASSFDLAFEQLHDYACREIEARADESQLKSAVVNAIYSFVNLLEVFRLEKNHIRYFKLNCYSLIHKAKNADEFLRQLEALIEDGKALVAGYQVTESRSEISMMMDYIQEHYNEPLQLQTLVDRFGFSYAYLSSLFSEKSSETFSEYLNRIRIEKACEPLIHSDQSIADIAQETGYSDSGYFSKVFKKQTGMTPRTYRRRNS
ncbi:response regulator transcription factor [Allobaculum sp. JKK-2023]|uniref:response regulator transcription factor n=1 Tax=Allobaculum sp. JKK-2023 TaxID=3108943 RepID=UPI002B05F215|nr:response regulator transcription factor [Allobaculum sp. JKK-2023]